MADPVFLVTGGGGFIGAWILKKLSERKIKVVGFDLKKDNGILSQVLDNPESIPFHYGDISNLKRVTEVFEDVKPTHILHLAGLQIPTCAANPRLGALVNVVGTVNVFEAAKQLRIKHPYTVRNIVYASSAALCGPPSDYKDGVVNDDDWNTPRTQYGVFKITNEGTARVYWESDKIPSLGLRPLTVYGVGREIGLTSAPTKAIKAALLGMKFEVGFTGTTAFHYVEDCAEIWIRSAQALQEGALVAGIKGTPHSIQEFVDIIHTLIPESKERITLQKTTRTLPFPSYYTAKTLNKLLGEKNVPTTPLKEGIQKIVTRFKALQSKGLLDSSDLVDPPAPAPAPSPSSSPSPSSQESAKSKSGKEVYLITGSQGFIGGWIIRKLYEEKKDIRVVGTDLRADPEITKKILGDRADKVETVYGNISDYKHVLELFEKVRPTHVIHLAALQIPACRANPPLGALVNVIGTLNVFEAAKELKTKYGHIVQCIGYASSAGACGPSSDYKDGLVHDNAHHVPRSHYGVFKLCNEGNARIYAQDHGIASIGLRPMTVYGVGREIGLTSDPTKAIRAALLGQPFQIGFKGLTNFNYVEDIADLFLRCVRGVKEGTYMCSIKGTEATVEEFVAIVKEIIPSSVDKITIVPDAPVLPFPYRFSAETLTKLFGKDGEQTSSLREGITKTVHQFQQLLSPSSRVTSRL